MGNKQVKNSKNKKKKKAKKSLWKKVLLVLVLLLAVSGGVFAYKTIKNGGGLSRNACNTCRSWRKY